MIEFVFTSHPTMIYQMNGDIRKDKLTVLQEFKEIDSYANNFINYLKKNKIDNFRISSWCGGDRDGHNMITPTLTSSCMNQIQYDLDIRDNSKKINNILNKVKSTKEKEELIDNISFHDTNKMNDLYDTISIMNDNQRFIISDCEYFYQIKYIYRLSVFLKKNIKIVPLFEESSSLQNSIEIIERCILEGIYSMDMIEVMLAYSDTNKKCGIYDSCFQLYFTQIKLHNLGKKYGKQINFFHGVGGSIPRGGGSFEEFLFRLPNDSLKNIRLTIQGEKVFQYFGDDKKIEQTLLLFTKALEKRNLKKDLFNIDYNKLLKINIVSTKSRLEYQNFINEEIIDIFLNNTYQKSLSDLNCGSRPLKRHTSGKITINEIRTITWVFGWSSIGFLLPWWLGYIEDIEDLMSSCKFPPWEYIIEHTSNGISNTKITNFLNETLINKFIEISKKFHKKNKNLDELINEIISRKYVG